MYEEAVSHIRLCNCSTLNFLIYEENLIFFFISVPSYSQLALRWPPVRLPSPITCGKYFS
jgi:hypothetical protein